MGKDFARQNRRALTEPEARPWRDLSAKRLGGFKFRKQHRINGYVADFFCPSIGLIVEVDGATHEADEDAKREHDLLSMGFLTVRFTNADVMTNVEGVCASILTTAQSLPPRFPG